MTVFELGVDKGGIDGDTDATPPGAIGIGCSAVFVCDPGRTIGLGSCMLAFVSESGFFVSANACVASEAAVRTMALCSRWRSESSYPVDQLVGTLRCKPLRSTPKANRWDSHPPG